MDKMGCPVVWWNIWYFLFGLLNCHGRCSEISWVLASGWQEQPGDHQCRGWIFWSWGSFPIRGHVNGKIIYLNVVMFDCQRVFVFGMHGLSHQIWWFRVNLSLHQSDKQWRYTGVCVCQHGRCGHAGSGYIFLICHQPTKWRDIASKEREISSKPGGSFTMAMEHPFTRDFPAPHLTTWG